MVRITVLSLLLGALALLASLTLFFSPPGATGRQPSPLTWNAATAWVEKGVGAINDGEMLLQLDGKGEGAVRLNSAPLPAQAYPFLHLAIEEPSRDLRVAISWNNDQHPQAPHTYFLESRSRQSLWLATAELSAWTGDISGLRLLFFGQYGETVRIRDFAIFPPSPAHQFLAIYSDLTGFVSWGRAAMNSHSGVTSVSSFYPVPLAISYLFLCLLAYAVLLMLFRAVLQFDWQVVALIFLACWISLDMVWQNRLLQQLADSYQTFSGKTTQEKLAAGPDAHLYRFVSQVIPLMKPRDARVFVSSSDEYLGLRTAYFLYPFNVYWQEPYHGFPDSSWLRSGDYVVLVKPSRLGFDRSKQRLLTSPSAFIDVERIFFDDTGAVFRAK